MLWPESRQEAEILRAKTKFQPRSAQHRHNPPSGLQPSMTALELAAKIRPRILAKVSGQRLFPCPYQSAHPGSDLREFLWVNAVVFGIFSPLKRNASGPDLLCLLT